jgi:lipopolysaccharide export system protein LptC
MAVELHLPDLPEVPLALGPRQAAPPPPRAALAPALRDALSTYLPLLLMALLALATWWLVKNTPRPPTPGRRPARATRPRLHDDAIRHRALRPPTARCACGRRRAAAPLPGHRPLEIDGARIRAIGADGR